MGGTTRNWEQWLHPDEGITYRLLTRSGITWSDFGERRLLFIEPALLRDLAREAFLDCSFYPGRGTVSHWAGIRDDSSNPEGERLVADALIRNAAIAAQGVLPLCQDTGTATVFGFKGDAVFSGGQDSREIALGIQEAWRKAALRHSQMAPQDLFQEVNSGDNLPAQIELRAVPGDHYRFLFIAKGGGSSNKTCLVQGSKALLTSEAMAGLLDERLESLGVAACPPYHIGVVIGGFSPEYNLTLLKLATAGYLDTLPTEGHADGRPFRDRAWEDRVLEMARDSGLGAQFGGSHLAADARVIRLPRHAGSCPISLGVSCSAHRNIRAKISARGVFLEEMDRHPERYLASPGAPLYRSTPIDLDQPMQKIRAALHDAGRGAIVSLDGPLVLARDVAHAHFRKLLQEGRPLPAYLKKHPVYYAGPAATPPGYAIGSLGPTTAQRMDPYVPELMAEGASLVMLGKGQRGDEVARACRRHGGFYLAAVGGAAALQTREHITDAEVIDHPEWGMEAVRRVRVRGLPALVVLDDR